LRTVVPKRQLTGFQLFAREVRDKLRDTGECIQVGQVMKRVGEQWSKLQRENKAVYENQALEMKEKLRN